MREKIIRFFKMWTLPLGMCAGFVVYFFVSLPPVARSDQSIGEWG